MYVLINHEYILFSEVCFQIVHLKEKQVVLLLSCKNSLHILDGSNNIHFLSVIKKLNEY